MKTRVQMDCAPGKPATEERAAHAVRMAGVEPARSWQDSQGAVHLIVELTEEDLSDRVNLPDLVDLMRVFPGVVVTVSQFVCDKSGAEALCQQYTLWVARPDDEDWTLRTRVPLMVDTADLAAVTENTLTPGDLRNDARAVLLSTDARCRLERLVDGRWVEVGSLPAQDLPEDLISRLVLATQAFRTL